MASAAELDWTLLGWYTLFRKKNTVADKPSDSSFEKKLPNEEVLDEKAILQSSKAEQGTSFGL